MKLFCRLQPWCVEVVQTKIHSNLCTLNIWKKWGVAVISMRKKWSPVWQINLLEPQRLVHVLLSEHYPGSIWVLSGFYPGSILILFGSIQVLGFYPDSIQLYPGSIRDLSGFCPGSILGLSGFYPGSIRVLSRFNLDPIPIWILSGFYPDPIQILSSSYLDSIQILLILLILYIIFPDSVRILLRNLFNLNKFLMKFIWN